MRIFNIYKGILDKNTVNVIIIFSEMAKIDFHTLVNQFNIRDNSVLVYNKQLLPKFLEETIYPIIFFLTNTNKIIYVNYSNYLNERKSEEFYKKIISIINNQFCY